MAKKPRFNEGDIIIATSRSMWWQEGELAKFVKDNAACFFARNKLILYLCDYPFRLATNQEIAYWEANHGKI